MVLYAGLITGSPPPGVTLVMRRIVVPNSASTTVCPTAGLGSDVIGRSIVSCTSPPQRSGSGPPPLPPVALDELAPPVPLDAVAPPCPVDDDPAPPAPVAPPPP